MRIEIKSSDEFERLLDALSTEVVNASIFFKLYRDLAGSTKDYLHEMNQSPAFWTLTFQAHFDSALIRLCRVYDVTPKALSLPNLLDTIRVNLHLFDTINFKERLQDNPFVDSLAETAGKLQAKQLAEDVSYVSKDNPAVVKLRQWRNKLYAHRDSTHVIEGKHIAVEHPLSFGEVSDLIENGATILNRYSSLFKAHTHSMQLVGSEDYQYVLESIKGDMEHHEKEVLAEVRKYAAEN